ncbi:MAG: hypothetical protein JNM41_15345 [Flavipsychrobacter sp.]|nr:hypothetical protein [Flavipsychrobacter sp.]
MRIAVLILSVVLLMLAMPARAGFMIKPPAVASPNTVEISQVYANKTVVDFPVQVNSFSCFNRVSWVGYATLVAAIVGLFVPAMSIIAILLGVIGMTRGCRADRLATIAMIAGIGELIYFLATNAALLSI